VKLACNEAYGRGEEPFIASLRELLGLIGAHEWRRTGVEIPALGSASTRTTACSRPCAANTWAGGRRALPARASLAFDIGTGTGVLSAVLAQRGIERVVATDQDPRPVLRARKPGPPGPGRQGRGGAGRPVPAGRAPLVVCNPPWVPARPSSPIEYAVYDPDSRMLRGFLAGLAGHLEPGGEGWLILSDLAEHLGLRPRAQLLEWIAQAGLKVVDRLDVKPTHPRAQDATDSLHAARSQK
jgi:methylase of polypeptide subunit release factors